jgi:hypothetical protein
MFELKDGKFIIHPDQLALPFFRVIYDADKSKGKETAFKELSYVYYMCDYKSPYKNYPEDKRKQLILDDIIKDKTWKESKDIKEACIKYKELIETPEIRLLQALEAKTDELADFLT